MADGTDKTAAAKRAPKIARRYGAFISYSHADKAHVESSADPKAQGFPIWLHRKLESYTVPASLRREYKREGIDLPKRIGRCFRDDDEFGSEEDLKSAIETALGRADNLIVICSPRSARSAYVNDEVRTFKHKNEGANVFAVILDGKPHDAERECFPQALKHHVDAEGAVTDAPAAREPVAADVQEFDRDTVFFKLVAGILGIEYGRLRDREKQAEAAKRRQAAALFTGGLLLVALALFGAFGVTRLMSGIGQRTANTMAELARQASEAGDFQRAARYALAGVNGADAPLIGFDARAAHVELVRAATSSRILSTMRDPSGELLGAAISPDATRIVTAGDDGVVRVWDTRTAKLIAALKGHTARVTSVDYSPNGALLVSVSIDRSIRLWDAKTLRPLRTMRTDEWLGSNTVAFSPDSQRFLTTDDTDRVLLWSIATGTVERVLSCPGQLRIARFSPDGAKVLTATRNGDVRFWDAATGEYAPPFDLGGNYQVNDIALSPDGKYVAVAADIEPLVMIFDARTLQQVERASGHTAPVRGVAFTPDSRRMVTVSEDRGTRLWALIERPMAYQIGEPPLKIAPIAAWRANTNEVVSVAFAAANARFVTASKDGAAKVWDASPQERLLHAKATVAVFDRSGTHLAVDHERDTQILDAASGETISTLHPPDLVLQLWPIAFTRDSGRLLVGGPDYLGIWDAQAGRQRVALKRDESAASSSIFAPNERTAVFSPDETKVLNGAGAGENTALLWDAATGRVIHILRGHVEAVRAVAFSPDGKRAATASADKTAAVWDVATGKRLALLRGHESGLSAIAFSPDGKLIATAGWDFHAMIWDASSFKRLAVLKGHDTFVDGVQFSPDGAHVLTYDRNSAARLWDKTGAPIHVFSHTEALTFANFSPSGDRVLTGALDEMVVTWDVKTGRPMQAITLRTGAAEFEAPMNARFSSDGRRIAITNGRLRLWDVSPGLARTKAMAARACAEVIPGAGAVLSPLELQAAPSLDGDMDADTCHPSSPWRKLAHALGFGAPR